MNNLPNRKLSAVLSFITASVLAGTIAKAQTAPTTPAPAASSDDTVELQKYVVTGSNIPQAAEALAIPVAVVDQTVMQNSGVASDALDMLRKVAPNISGIGQENAQISTGTNFGGASLTIKGLPTLILLDGRRVADDPAQATGGSQFVDLNMIPLAAVDRFEILQDGASAIYGSDAIGGVINIILKKDYNGWEAGGHYGFSTDTGHYEERSGYLTGGVSTDKTSITLTFDYAQHNQLMLSTRPYTNPIYGTYTFPGSIDVYDNLSGVDTFYQLAPGLNAPPGGGKYTIAQLVSMGVYVPESSTAQFQTFNLANNETLIGQLKRYSAMANFDHKIFGDNLVAFGNVLAARTVTQSQLNAQPVVPYLEDAWVDVNVFGYPSSPPPAGTTYVPVTSPGNPFSQAFLDQGQTVAESQPGYGDGSGEDINARARFIQFPRIYHNESDLFRVVGGLKGDITPDYHWEMAADINRYSLDYTNSGLIDTVALNNALQDGQLNPFARVQAAGAFNGVVGTAFVDMLSTLQAFDVKVDGTPFELPAGKLGFAVGVNYDREVLSANPDVNSLPNATGTTQGWSNATTFNNFTAVRDVMSEFAELSIPVLSAKQGITGANKLDIDGAVRHDDYNGQVGSTTNPEVSVGFQPFDDQFKVRASAGKSFIAPQLFQLYGPTSAGSTVDITYNPSGGGAAKTVQFNQTGGANPGLQPETATSWSVGFVATPKAVDGLSVSVDFSEINEKKIFGVVPAATLIQSVETQGTASPYASLIHFNSSTGTPVTGVGQISSHSPQQVYVTQNDINLAGQKILSTDIAIDYVKKVTGVGRFEINSTWTLYNSYQLQQIPTEQYYG